MPRSTDQTGHLVQLPELPRRIISLVPSQSEFLWDIGIQHDSMVGITKFCIHPREMLSKITRVGGTKNISIEKIKELQPDFILANKEENEMESILELKKYFPVWVSDITKVEHAFHMMLEVGRLCGLSKAAENYVRRIESARKDLIDFREVNQKSFSVAYFIWKKPWMAAGRNTFIDALLNEAGFQNVFNVYERYPAIKMDDILRKQPELIFLSSEPYPFSDEDVLSMQQQFPFARVRIVDGEMFSWYGTRMEKAYVYFRKIWEELQ